MQGKHTLEERIERETLRLTADRDLMGWIVYFGHGREIEVKTEPTVQKFMGDLHWEAV